MTELTVLPDSQSAAEHAAEQIAHALADALDRRGVAHLALAGGNTPKRAYQLLGGLLADWSAVELWYGDERCVGPEDPQSNHLLVAESLLASITGPPPIEHRILGELGPQAAAEAYAQELRAHMPPAEQGEPPTLDVALLGVGSDGHTASLFPGHPELLANDRELCLPVSDAPKPPPERVTLSLPVLRGARLCLLLATGPEKAGPIASVLAGPDARVPASLLASERLRIIVDDASNPARKGPHHDDPTADDTPELETM